MALSVGTPAPDFTLKTMTAEGLADVHLSSFRGSRNVVLLFVPAAFTGVCTTEFCDMTGALDTYRGLDAEVIGISADSPFAQAAWAKQEGIGLTLASDYQKETIRAYDVVLDDLAGLGMGSKRAAFVIDKEGVIRYSEATPTPKDLPDFAAVQQALTDLQ